MEPGGDVAERGVRTHLTTIKLAAQLIERDSPAADRRRAHARAISAASGSATC